MISAVIDPSVLVSAFIGDASAGTGRVLTAWKEKRFSLVVSPLVLAELDDVLSRAKFERWTNGNLGDDYIALLATEGENQPDPGIAPSVVRDPKDDYLVALSRWPLRQTHSSPSIRTSWSWRSRASPSADLSRSWGG